MEQSRRPQRRPDVVAAPGGALWAAPGGNAALATAGTGDVLAGTIGGFLAQGLSPLDAAICGVHVGARAAERAADAVGEYGMVAPDSAPRDRGGDARDPGRLNHVGQRRYDSGSPALVRARRSGRDCRAMSPSSDSVCQTGCAFGAVVKADGYGHGAAPVARAALAGGASWLLVATVPEGVALRRAGLAAIPILVLGAVAAEEVAGPRRAPTSPRPLTKDRRFDAIAAVAAAMDKAPYPVHVKVDTGLNRFGVAEERAIAFVRRATADPRLSVDGLSTHFATADVIGDPFLAEQERRFAAIVAALSAHGLRPRVVHAANSGAALQGVACWDMVRVGIALYGIPPAPDFPMPPGLVAALSVQSRVVRVIDLPAGATVGYGRTFTASRPCRAAVVPVGYADGLPRSLSNRGSS